MMNVPVWENPCESKCDKRKLALAMPLLTRFFSSFALRRALSSSSFLDFSFVAPLTACWPAKQLLDGTFKNGDIVSTFRSLGHCVCIA